MKHKFIFFALAAAITPSMSFGMRSSKVASAIEGKPPMCKVALRLSYAAWLEAQLLKQNEKYIFGQLQIARNLLEKKVELVAFQEWRVTFLEQKLENNKYQWESANNAYLDALLPKDEKKRD